MGDSSLESQVELTESKISNLTKNSVKKERSKRLLPSHV